jgi:anion transporter
MAMPADHSEPDSGERQAVAQGSQQQHSGTWDHREYARLLRRIDLFGGLDRVVLAKLAAHLQPLAYPSSSIVFRQGDAGDAFYVVASGTVGVYVTDRSGAVETRVTVLHAGDPFGEMALLSNIPRSATIRAETDCDVLRLERSSFLDLVRDQPTVALAVAATLSRRLADMLDQPGGLDAALTAAPPLRAVEGAVAAAAAAATRPRWRPGRAGIALTAAVALLGAGWAVPPPTGLSPIAWYALVVLLAALPALLLDALLEGVLALLLAGAWVVFGITTPAVALSGFASPNWVLVVAVLIIGAAITATGVLYRLALETITHMRGGFAGEVIALSCAGVLMGPAVPNATSRVIIIAPMLRELVEALGYGLPSKAAAGLAMAALIGFGQMAAMFLTSSTTAVLVSAVIPAQAHGGVNWITWAVYGSPPNTVLFIGLVASIVWVYRPAAGERQASSQRKQSLELQHALLGPMSREEKIAVGVGIGLLAGFITEPLHRAHPAWVAVLATGVLAATRVVTANTLRAVNWNFALLFGVLISLATVFARTGLDRWITDRVTVAMGDLKSIRVAFLLLLTLFCFAISFVVRWQAAAPLVTIAMTPIASAAGVHPFIVGVIAVIACNGFWVPYQSTTYLALYAGTAGQVFSHGQATPAAIAYGVWTLVAVTLSVPVWRWMGLL